MHSENFTLEDGRTIGYCLEGPGDSNSRSSVTVIFESGLGCDRLVWADIQKVISSTCKTLSYDRAGEGQSSESIAPRTIESIFDDFRQLIEGLNVQPPFILVGHSLGCIYNKYAADKLGDKVVGQVFVDGSTPAFKDLKFNYRTEAQAAYWKEVIEGEGEDESEIVDPFCEYAARHELLAVFNQVPFNSNILNTVIVCDEMSGWFNPAKDPSLSYILVPVNVLLKDNSTWVGIHKKWIDEMPSARFVIAENSGHMIQFDRPDIVLEEIQRMVGEL